MSDAGTYYQALIARGYSEEEAEAFTKIHFPDVGDSSKPEGIATIDLNSKFNIPSNTSSQFLLSVLLSIAAIVLITMSIFSNSWMTGVESDDFYGFDFGLTEFYSYEIGVESDSVGGSYSDFRTGVDEGENAGNRAYFAGLIGISCLILGILAAIVNLFLFVSGSLGTYYSDYLRRYRFYSSGLVFVGSIVWLALFPTSDMVEFTEINLDLGIGFYLALMGGVAGFLSGIMQFGSQSSSKYYENGEQESLNSDVFGSMMSLSFQSINSTTKILTLILLSMVAIFISMFTNNWIIGTYDYESSYFGLHEESWTYQGNAYILDYSFGECQEIGYCSELGDAGSSAFIMLLFSIFALTVAMVLIHLNSIGLFESNYGKIAAISGGAISILATIVFYTMFPDLSEFDVDTSLGYSFYLVGFSGIVAIVSGLMEHKSQAQ